MFKCEFWSHHYLCGETKENIQHDKSEDSDLKLWKLEKNK